MSDTVHVHPPDTPDPTGRDYFLVDGCPRCEEYVEDLGVYFTPDRFRAFWEHMALVEWDSGDSYKSNLDRKLGGRLYLVSLSFANAFGLHPRMIQPSILTQLRDGLGVEVTDPRD